MTLRRALERLEAVSPAVRLYDEGQTVLPAALRVAVRGVEGGFNRVTESPAWTGLVAPFPVHLAGSALNDEATQRLGDLMPVIEDVGGTEAVKTFLACLAFNLVNE